MVESEGDGRQGKSYRRSLREVRSAVAAAGRAASDPAAAWPGNAAEDALRSMRLFVLFLGAQFRVSRYTIDALFLAVPDVIKKLQGTKHGSHPDEEFEAGISLLGDVITILLPNRRR